MSREATGYISNSAQDGEIKNNLIHTTLYDGIYKDSAANTPTEGYNSFYNTGESDCDGLSCSNSVTDDPLLADPANNNFYLNYGSPALGTGENGIDIGALGVHPNVGGASGAGVSFN